MKRRGSSAQWGIVLGLVFILSMGTFAWAAPSGKVTIGVDTDTPTMDPHRHAEAIGRTVNWQIFDSLLLRRADMKIGPNLAESYKVVNPTTIEMSLKKGVQFHNGEPFNAQAVKFSLERPMDPKIKSPRLTSVNWIKSVDVVDSYTVRIQLKNPYPMWQEDLQNLGIVPPKYIAEKGDAYFAENPVGTGPYKFVKWVRGQEIQMTANTAYHRGEPRIEQVIFKIIPDNSTRLAALLSGAIGIMAQVSPDDLPVVKANTNLAVSTVPTLRVQWFYLADALTPDSPLSKKEVRQALNYAVNMPEIVQNIVGGLGAPAVVLSPMHVGYDPNVKPYPHDLEKAKALLKQAGYPNGFPMTLHYTTVNMVKGEEVIQAVQAQLAQAGVQMKLQKWSPVGYMDIVRSGRGKPAFALNWGSLGMFDGDAILTPFFRGEQAYAFFHTPELDRILDAQRQEMDPQKRKDLMSKAQQIIREEAPWVFSYSFQMIVAQNSKLDYKPRSDENYYLFDAAWKK